MCVLLDTNVWLAILTTDGKCRQLWRGIRDRVEIIASPEILCEIEAKLKVKFGFSPRHARLLAAFVRRQTRWVEVKNPPPQICRDPDDNLILAAALTAPCGQLVTGDKDLLVLKEFSGVSIVTPAAFAKLVV